MNSEKMFRTNISAIFTLLSCLYKEETEIYHRCVNPEVRMRAKT